MTEKYKIVFLNGLDKLCSIEDTQAEIPTFYNDLSPDIGAIKPVCDLLNEQNNTITKQNQEILSCHYTLVTIEGLCDAILNYDFKDVNDKIDFCHMLNEMDNKDLAFLKEAFTAIRDNDLKQMTSLTRECTFDE